MRAVVDNTSEARGPGIDWISSATKTAVPVGGVQTGNFPRGIFVSPISISC